MLYNITYITAIIAFEYDIVFSELNLILQSANSVFLSKMFRLAFWFNILNCIIFWNEHENPDIKVVSNFQSIKKVYFHFYWTLTSQT